MRIARMFSKLMSCACVVFCLEPSSSAFIQYLAPARCYITTRRRGPTQLRRNENFKMLRIAFAKSLHSSEPRSSLHLLQLGTARDHSPRSLGSQAEPQGEASNKTGLGPRVPALLPSFITALPGPTILFGHVYTCTESAVLQ